MIRGKFHGKWLACACAFLLARQSLAAGPLDFDIAAGDLATALQALAKQSGIELIYSSTQLKGMRTFGVHGRYTVDAAISKLLEGTHLTVTVHDSGAMLIAPPAQKSSEVSPGISELKGGPAGEAVESGDRPRVSRTDQESVAHPGLTADTDASIPTDSDTARRALEEIVITGTNIRGVRNDTTPVLTLDRDYIERSGYSSMSQLVQSLPANFSGGPSGSSETAAFGNSAYAGQNLTRGTGFNLHGLGSVATLTLINGRRVAPAAEGQFVDISNIPLAAVDRIEILTDGASAIYGADAVAGVVNIILRKNFDGAQTSLEGGTATRGGTSQERVSQTLGRTWDGGNALLVGDFTKRTPLDTRDRDYIVAAGGAPAFGPTYLLPKRNVKSLVFNFNQALPERFDLTANGIYSHSDVHQARTDTTGAMETDDPRTNQWSGMLGVGYQAGGDWRFELDGTASRMQTLTDFTDVDIPTRTITFLINNYRDTFNTWSADFKADGSLLTLPAGRVRLAAGGSYRKDRLQSTRFWVIPARGWQVHGDDQRDVKAGFAELFVPVVAREQRLPWARRIDLSAALRYDDYSDFGGTTNPKVGLVWTPVESLDVRVSYGTSFRAPSMAEKALVARGLQISTDVVDGPGGSQVPIFDLSGSAPLTAEKSKDLSVGFTWTPEPAPGAQLTVNYFNIDYTGRISTPPFDLGMLFERSRYGSLITDLADDAAAQSYLDAAIAAGDLYIDNTENGTGAMGVRHVFDWRQQNAARSRIDGLDLAAGYVLNLAAGNLDLNVDYTRINRIRTSLLSDTTAFDEVNTYEQPLRNRVRAMATWTRTGFAATTAINYSNAYTNASVLPQEPIAAWTTVDLNLSYDFAGHGRPRLLDGLKVGLSISNLFDVNPPHANDPLHSMGFDVFNADPVGRFVTLRMSERW